MTVIPWLHAHLYVGYAVIAVIIAVMLGLLVVCVRVSRPHTGSRVRDDRYQGHHTPEAVVEQQWADDVADEDYATAPFAPDLSSDATIRKYQLEAWDSAGFPAVPRTVQTVTLPPLVAEVSRGERSATELPIPSLPAGLRARTADGPGIEPGDLSPLQVESSSSLSPRLRNTAADPAPARSQQVTADFPDGAGGMPAPAAGVGLAADAVSAGGEPSTDLPGPVRRSTVPGAPQSEDRRAGEPFWRRLLRRPTVLPVAVTVPRAPQPPQCAGPDGDGEPACRRCGGHLLPDEHPYCVHCLAYYQDRDDEPVLEGRILTGPPPPVLGYIDGLALTSTYYERLEQIGVQARVLALAAAA